GYVEFFGGKTARETGIVTMRDAAGNLCGILTYALHRSLELGPLLAVPLFTAVDVANSQGIVSALLDAAERQAAAIHCRALEIHLDRAQPRLADHLRRLGFSAGGGVFGKTIHGRDESR